jgi:hypothetical protein
MHQLVETVASVICFLYSIKSLNVSLAKVGFFDIDFLEKVNGGLGDDFLLSFAFFERLYMILVCKAIKYGEIVDKLTLVGIIVEICADLNDCSCEMGKDGPKDLLYVTSAFISIWIF